MAIRVTARHLRCPACGSALTPVNRLCERLDASTVHVLKPRNPHWLSSHGACRACVERAHEHRLPRGLIQRVADRFGRRGATIGARHALGLATSRSG